MTEKLILKRDVFKPREAFKPYEYPEMVEFADKMSHNYWTHDEWSFKDDFNDYHTVLTDDERQIVVRSTLAIAHIEVSTVKTFWGDMFKRFPKSEFAILGGKLMESEIRHSEAYSKILDVLGLNDEFSKILEVPCIKGRVDYLKKYLSGAKSKDNEMYTKTLALFSLFIEGCSLFSQFYIFKSIHHHGKGVLKDMDNVTQATQGEEILHSKVGTHIINNILKIEKPEWFNDQFYRAMEEACKKAFKAEIKILDWIFENDVKSDYVSKETVIEFTKDRFNKMLVSIGCNEIFEIDAELKKESYWYDVELIGETHVDFFHKNSPNYSKFNKSFDVKDATKFFKNRLPLRDYTV